MKTLSDEISSRDTKIRRRENEVTEYSLPSEIIFSILSRVPSKTVFCCKAVCKPWLSIINTLLFQKEHLSRAPVCPLLVYDGVCSSPVPGRIIMHLVEGENNHNIGNKCSSDKPIISGIGFSNVLDQIPKDQTSSRGYSFLRRNENIVSCEGLICCPVQHYYGGGHVHALICNPITGEYLTLDLECTDMVMAHDDNQEKVSVFIGLGFCHVDRKFKLLRMSKLKKSRDRYSWWPELCHVEIGGWQRVEVPSMPQHRDFSKYIDQVIYVNGGIYWMFDDEPFVVYFFDFDSVVFRAMRLPRRFVQNRTSTSTIGVLGNSLCVSLISCGEHVEMWKLEKDGGKENIASFKWRKMHIIRKGVRKRREYKVIKYLECGKVLLHSREDAFIIYDPITKAQRSVRVLDKHDKHSIEPGKLEYLCLRIVPHVPSFSSLRDALNLQDEGVSTVLKEFPRISSRGTGTRFSRTGKTSSSKHSKS